MYDDDEDFPLNGGSDKLAKLFEENALPDISFKFPAPKPPTATKPSKPLHNNVPLKVVHGRTVEAFQMKIGGYKSEGKVGLAIIGNDEYSYYQLYMYRSDEKKVASVEITFQFGFLVQEYNYATFKDAHGIQWSVRFDKTQDIVSFTKEVALARWKSAKGCHEKLVQDAFKGKTDLIAKRNDNLCVSYNIYFLSSDNVLHEETTLKTVTAPANVTTWETNLVGSCAKSKRFVIIPELMRNSLDISVPDGCHIFLEMEVLEITEPQANNNTGSSELPPQPTSPLSLNTSSQNSTEKKEEVESNSSLSGRMARIGYQLPILQTAVEPESNSSLSEQMKPAPPSKKTSLSTSASSNQSIYSKDDGISLIEPSDVTATSHFNVLFSEVRTSNSEIRMNINRVTDKVDSLLSKMDFVPQINHKVIPAIDKFQNVDSTLNKLVDQNNTIMMLLEKNCTAKLESAINEVAHLKKRNAELESVLEIAKSNCQILKGKVIELNHKVSEMEKYKNLGKNSICSNCEGNGEKKIKSLEASLKNLQERNYSLLEATGHLERQNRELSSQTRSNKEVSILQGKLAEKDSKIAQLEKEMSTYVTQPSSEVAPLKFFIQNVINEIMKEEKIDMIDGSYQFDESLSRVIKEAIREHIKTTQMKPSLRDKEHLLNWTRELTAEEPDEQGNPSFFPSSLPPLLPIPRPRKPFTADPMPNTFLGHSKPSIKEIKLKGKLKSRESGSMIGISKKELTEPGSMIDVSNKELSEPCSMIGVCKNDLTECGSNIGVSKKVLTVPKTDKSLNNNCEESSLEIKPKPRDKKMSNKLFVNNNISNEANINSDEEPVGNALYSSSEMDTTVDEIDQGSHDSQSDSSPSKESDDISASYNPYSSTYSTPFLRNTPPPIIED